MTRIFMVCTAASKSESDYRSHCFHHVHISYLFVLQASETECDLKVSLLLSCRPLWHSPGTRRDEAVVQGR